MRFFHPTSSYYSIISPPLYLKIRAYAFKCVYPRCDHFSFPNDLKSLISYPSIIARIHFLVTKRHRTRTLAVDILDSIVHTFSPKENNVFPQNLSIYFSLFDYLFFPLNFLLFSHIAVKTDPDNDNLNKYRNHYCRTLLNSIRRVMQANHPPTISISIYCYVF